MAVPVNPDLVAFRTSLQQHCDVAVRAASSFFTTMDRLEEITDTVLNRYGIDPIA